MEEIKIIQPEVSSYLSKLTSIEIEQVIKDFHEKELKISDIIKKYDLEEVKNSEFKDHLPPVQNPDNICPICNAQSVAAHKSRGSLSNPYCPCCKVSMYENYSPEDTLKQLEWDRMMLKQEEELMNMPTFIQSDSSATIDVTLSRYEALKFEVKVFLGSLVINGISEDYQRILGWDFGDLKLYPNRSKIDYYLSELGEISKTIWEIHFYFEPEVSRKLLLPKSQLGSSQKKQLQLWKQIVIDEAHDLLAFQMNESGLEIVQGPIVEEILTDLLLDYSLGQVFHIIYNAVNEACKLHSKNNDRAFVSKTAIYNCLKIRDRYKSNGWALKAYNRPGGCKQSEMSNYFFDSVLNIGDNGFYQRPSIELLPIV